MSRSPLLSFLLFAHVAAAILGLLSGLAAMSLRKGSPRHRIAGHAFTVFMLTMSASAVYLAFMKNQTLNGLVGCLTFYLVATAWMTVHRQLAWTWLIDGGALLFAACVAAVFLIGGLESVHAPTGLSDGESPVGYFVFGAIAIIAATLDVQMIRTGGAQGAHRLARHLWRM